METKLARAFLGCIAIAIPIAGIAGWVMNVIAVVHTVGLPLTGMFLLRVAGIAFPLLGGVLGYVG